jgi:hypothetical protein
VRLRLGTGRTATSHPIQLDPASAAALQQFMSRMSPLYASIWTQLRKFKRIDLVSFYQFGLSINVGKMAEIMEQLYGNFEP